MRGALIVSLADEGLVMVFHERRAPEIVVTRAISFR